KKSKFITLITHVESKEEVDRVLLEVRNKYKDARHHVYTYFITSSLKGASEDKEPIKSAHRLLTIFENKGINNILAITTRYFGGIELGASNLERTYVSVVTDLLDKAEFKEEVTYVLFKAKTKSTSFNIFKKRLIESKGEIKDCCFFGNEVEVSFLCDRLDDYFKTYLYDIVETDIKETKYK
ncbi:MAG: YigZ family protein, partial [Bacilli bacterium]|nr:YigZ family protein [Bacilli bacterium]MDY4155658.1 YigZ family protein [Bacilli bacterium]MDY5937539.1 YigZ family protein [Bacilli bacterium]MDY6048834.1 YigZ family protein [Bacilli bacterium]